MTMPEPPLELTSVPKFPPLPPAPPPVFAVPFFIAAVFAVILYLIVPISGAALSPALSLVYYLNGKIGWREAVIYSVVQLLAAVSSYYTYAALV